MVPSLLLLQRLATVAVERQLGALPIEHRMGVTMDSHRRTITIQVLTPLARDLELPPTLVPAAAVHRPGERHLNLTTRPPQHLLMQIIQLPTLRHQHLAHLHLPPDSQQMPRHLVVTTTMPQHPQLPDRIPHHWVTRDLTLRPRRPVAMPLMRLPLAEMVEARDTLTATRSDDDDLVALAATALAF